MEVSHCLMLLAVSVTSLVAADVPRSPPRIEPVSDLPQRHFKPGTSFNLPCTATGNPTPTCSWTLNGEPSMAEDNTCGKRTVNGSYQTTGNYQCTATNRWGTSMSQVITLQMAGCGSFPPSKRISDKRGKVGEPLKVPWANVDCVPTPTYHWSRIKNVDDKAPVHISRDKRVLQDIQGNLYFTSLQPEDNSTNELYKVEVFNNILDASIGGSYTRIRVEGTQVEESAPKLLYPESSQHKMTAVEGGELRVQCIFGGRPEVTVTWKGTDNPRLTQEEAGTRLKLSNVTLEDAGTYTCTGTNTVGTDSASIQVEVHTLPKFAKGGKPESHNKAFTGDSVTFNCQYSADTNPAPTVIWMKNGVEITKDLNERSTLTGITHGTGKELTMKNLQRGDTGVVQCKLSNRYGTVYAEATLNVFGKTILTVKPVSTWLKPNVTEVKFMCSGSADPDTPPPTITWQYKGRNIQNKEPAMQVDGGTLKISLQGTASDVQYTGAYTCTATDGLSQASATATLYATRAEMDKHYKEHEEPVPMVAAASSSLTLVGAGVALFLLVLLVLALVAVVRRNKQKGQTYHSEKRERKVGINPLADRERLTFVEYQRRPDRVPKASNASIRGPPTCGSDAGDSVVEYGDLTEGKFDEDGSFIGVYSLEEERSAT